MDAYDTKTTKCAVVIMKTWTEEVLKQASVIHADLHGLDHHRIPRNALGGIVKVQCDQAKEMFDGYGLTQTMF
jgi:hypothetical protein